MTAQGQPDCELSAEASGSLAAGAHNRASAHQPRRQCSRTANAVNAVLAPYATPHNLPGVHSTWLFTWNQRALVINPVDGHRAWRRLPTLSKGEARRRDGRNET